MALTLDDYYSQLIPLAKPLEVNDAEDLQTIAYYAIFMTLFPDSSKYYTKLKKIIDKKLARYQLQGSPLTTEIMEQAYNHAKFPEDLYRQQQITKENDRNEALFAPIAIELFSLWVNGDKQTLKSKISTLPADYPFYQSLEGQLLLLLVAIDEQQWDIVRSTLALCSVLAQNKPDLFPYQSLLGHIIRTKVPAEYLPWMMKQSKQVEVNGEVFHCMPFMMTTSSIIRQFEVHQREISFPDVKTFNAMNIVPQYQDSTGRRYVSGSSLIAASMTNATMHSLNVMGAAAQVAVQSIMKALQKGSWSVFIGAGANAKISSSKDVLFPLGTCGYIISRDSTFFADWNNAVEERKVSAGKIKNYCGVYNLFDDSFYDESKQGLPEQLKEALRKID